MRTQFSRRRRPTPERLESRDLPVLTITPIVEYPLPRAASGPVDVALGADNALWVTESAANKIARFDPNLRSFNEYSVPTANSTPYRIVPGGPGDPSLYFTERSGGKLGRITTSGVLSEAPVVDSNNNPIPDSPLVSLAYDPLGSAIYATQLNAQQVGLFQVGDFFEYVPFQSGQARPTASAPNSGNWGVAFDRSLQSTSVYFTERDANKIGVFELDSNGNFVTHEYALAAGSKPLDIVQGPDGAFWFTESGSSKIGRIDPTTRAITEYATPTSNSGPWGIASGNGHLYFTESTASRIGRITFGANNVPTINEYALAAGGTPRGITPGQSGQVWFAEESGNRLGLFFGDATNIPPDAFTAAVPLLSGNYQPIGLAASPDGHLYAYIYAQAQNADGVAAIDPNALIAQEFPLNVGGSFPPYGAGAIGGGWMGVSSDGRLWLGSSVTGTIEFQVLPQFGMYLNIPLTPFASLVRGPNPGTMYGPFLNVSTGNNNAYSGFAKFDASGRTNLSFPLAFVGTGTFDSSGNLWTIGLDDLVRSVIARTDTSGNTTTTSVNGLTGGSLLSTDSITVGPDGNIWFTFNNSLAIGRLTPSSGQVTLFPTGDTAPGGSPLVSLISAPDGNLWYLDALSNSLVRVDPATGAQTPFLIPTPIASPTSFYPINTLTVGPDGNLWVSNADPKNPGVVRFSLPKTSSSVSTPTVGSYLAGEDHQLSGLTLSANRQRTLLTQALGRHSSVSAATALGTLTEPLRSRVLSRLTAAVLSSPEYRRARLEQLAFATLRRPADPRLLQTRAPLATVRLRTLASPSYLQTRAAGRSADFVTALFHDVLGRAPTTVETRRWDSALAHSVSRITMASTLTFSREGLATAVQRTYIRLLGRPAESGEVNSGVRLMQRASTIDALVQSILISPEYLARQA